MKVAFFICSNRNLNGAVLWKTILILILLSWLYLVPVVNRWESWLYSRELDFVLYAGVDSCANYCLSCNVIEHVYSPPSRCVFGGMLCIGLSYINYLTMLRQLRGSPVIIKYADVKLMFLLNESIWQGCFQYTTAIICF